MLVNEKSRLIDKRNFLLILFVLLLIILMGFWIPFKNSERASDTAGSTGHATITIEYTERGFEPNTITVPLGTTVAWKNPTGRPMWVGSDPHPAHTNLEGFDQRRVINKATNPFVKIAEAHGDAIYEYTFSKLGEWKYHNHVYPEHRGTVVVVEQ